MERLAPADLERLEGEFDAAVAATPQIDRFCSSPDWILPCREAWSPDQEEMVLRGEHGWATLLAYSELGGRRVLTGFDTIWGFACPLVGANPTALARELSLQLLGGSLLMLSGILKEIAEGNPMSKAIRPQADGLVECAETLLILTQLLVH